MSLLVTIPLLVFAYHYLRNGWPLSTPEKKIGNFPARVMWCLAVAVAFCATAGADSTALLCISVFLSSFVAIITPHGIGMDMGRHMEMGVPVFQNSWLTFFIKFSQEEWKTFSPRKRELIDAAQLSVIGLVRGLIVFVPAMLLGAPVGGCVAAALLQGLFQPLSYWVGYRVPLTALNNHARSSEWGEFLVGVGWAISLFFAV